MKIRLFLGVLLLAFTLVACSSPISPADSTVPPPLPDPEVETEPAPFINLKSSQGASVVIGQDDFTTSSQHAAADVGFDSVYGSPLVIDGVLYLPDHGVGRVMGYTSIPTTNGVAADFVLGKTDFTGGDGGAEVSLIEPGSIFTDGTNVFVTDFLLNRIMRYDGAPTASGVSTSHVIGQPDFTTLEYGCSPTRIDGPDGAIIVDDKLIVVDSINNRVLIWNTVPTAIDEPANIVLGQVNLDTCDFAIGGPTDNNFLIPRDVWSDGTRLLVVDGRNNRVLGWNEFPTVHNASADFVLGQDDFTSNDHGTGPARVDFPNYIASNGTQIFLSDANNNRVLIWNEFPTQNGAEADVALGQIDFDQRKTNFGFSTTNKYGFNNPTGLFVHDNLLIVGDLYNHRYLVFEGE